MAKESENKAFYKGFCESYEEFFNKIKQIRSIQSEQKRRAKCWLQPYIMLCLEKGFVPCGLNDLDPITTTTKILEKTQKCLKNFFILF